jgi:hypothetical protein
MLLFRFHNNSPRNGLLTKCHTTLRGRRTVALCLLALLWLSAQLAAQPNPPAGLTFGLPERISLAPNGAEPDAPSFSPSVSADGRYVLYTSRAGNLLPGMPPGSQPYTCAEPIIRQWYVFDRQTKTLERVSKAPDGSPARQLPRPANCATIDTVTYSGGMSADGRYASFVSFANNLAPGESTLRARIYRFDRQENRIERVSVGPNGEQPQSTEGGHFVHDDTANQYLFACRALLGFSVLSPVLSCLKNMQTGAIAPAIRGTNGELFQISPGINYSTVAISGNGRYLAYASSNPVFLPEPGNGTLQVVRYEIATGNRVIVSRRRTGELSSFVSADFILEPIGFNFDGTVMTFAARDAGPPTALRSSVAIWRESVGYMETAIDVGTQLPDQVAMFPTLSDDGGLLLYGNSGVDLAFPPPGIEPSALLELWLHRTRAEGATGRFVRTTTGNNIGGFSRRGHCDLPIPDVPVFLSQQLYLTVSLNCPQFSGSGNLAVFITRGDDLVPGDTNMGLTSEQLRDVVIGQRALDIYAVPIFDAEKRVVVPVQIGNRWLWGALALLVLWVGIRVSR